MIWIWSTLDWNFLWCPNKFWNQKTYKWIYYILLCGVIQKKGHFLHFFEGRGGGGPRWWMTKRTSENPILPSSFTYITVQKSLFECLHMQFSKHQPSGPMLSISRNVLLSVCPSGCLSVCVFTFDLPFKHLFAPASRSQMSHIFKDLDPWRKVMVRNGLRFEHFCLKIVKNRRPNKVFFCCWFCLTKYGVNHASQWIRDLWLKSVTLILAYL